MHPFTIVDIRVLKVLLVYFVSGSTLKTEGLVLAPADSEPMLDGLL